MAPSGCSRQQALGHKRRTSSCPSYPTVPPYTAAGVVNRRRARSARAFTPTSIYATTAAEVSVYGVVAGAGTDNAIATMKYAFLVEYRTDRGHQLVALRKLQSIKSLRSRVASSISPLVTNLTAGSYGGSIVPELLRWWRILSPVAVSIPTLGFVAKFANER